ncbi:MAG: PLP-dependent cysteine synthase family protein [Firmicutes bacterium]|nr:PLP-dependent cysteine synthase family protein [Bacillota bacterium]
MKFESVLGTIGNTPMVDISLFSPNPQVKIWAKLEGDNPGGSVKDRTAKYLFAEAERKEALLDERILLEPTSGNTGIALAMIAAIKGYRFTAVMPDNVSWERRKLLAAYGAELILTEGAKGTNGSIEAARQMVKDNPTYYMFDQFENDANPKAHYETTGAEIIADVPEINAFVAGVGTGGTLTGAGRRLREYSPSIKLIGLEPVRNSGVQGLRNMEDYKPLVYDDTLLDEKMIIPDEESFRLARALFKQAGISAGISSGAALWGAIEYAKIMKKGTIVTVFPDRVDKYMSTNLLD